MSDNPLVAGPSATSPTQGAKAFGSLNKAATEYSQVFTAEDFSFMEAGGHTAAAALDVLGFIGNPFKTLLQVGLGWLIEHISFIREPFDSLAGDPQEIDGVAKTWSNISAELSRAANEWTAELQSVQDWEGKDAEGYRAATAEFTTTLQGLADSASKVGGAMNVAGACVGVVRSVILEIITSFLAEAIMLVLAALASAGFTFGATAAAATARVVSRAVSVFAKMMSKLGELLKKCGKLNEVFKGFSTQSAALRKALDSAQEKLGKRIADPLKESTDWPVPFQKVSKYFAAETADASQINSQMVQDQEAARNAKP